MSGVILCDRHFDIRKTTLELFMMVIITSLFSVLAAFVLVYMQSKKISKPIEEINKAARELRQVSLTNVLR